MKQIRDILNSSGKKSPLFTGVRAALVVEAANAVLQDILPPGAHQLAHAAYLKGKMLTVACLSSVAAQEIRLYEQEIIARINKKMGPGTVERIRYSI